jgi:putative Mg2+ transporter-C (MgtC) family protein
MDLVDTNWLGQLEVAAMVVVAGLLGGIVGFERELAHRPAGLRTHAILAAAAALLVGTVDLLIAHFADQTSPVILRADPIRAIEAIVTGVAFLGAGTIFRRRSGNENSVEGLTTAASMLLVAAIGIAVALRQILLAVLVTIITLMLLRIVAAFFNVKQ